MRLLVLGALLVLACGPALAHRPSAVECREAGDFIRNAARSRDGGTTREFFIDRLKQDYVLIRAFRPELRWFVLDADDEEFLQAEVELVFDAPLADEQHRADFIERCAVRSGVL
ncbi:MAG TPA: hypothetical protein VMU46_01960 [Burkholderiales bacterium]|nr:hypothetical protein [Burkholderiales bacterium]